MDQSSMQKLKIDRRLLRRRGWLSDQDVDRELEALPDVSDKMAQADAPASDPGSGGESS